MAAISADPARVMVLQPVVPGSGISGNYNYGSGAGYGGVGGHGSVRYGSAGGSAYGSIVTMPVDSGQWWRI